MSTSHYKGSLDSSRRLFRLTHLLRAAAIGIALALLIARPARATIIYDNLAAAPASGYASPAPNNFVAERFNSDATNLHLDSVTLFLASQTATSMTLGLFSDVSGHPGASLATLYSGSTSALPASPGGHVSFSGLDATLQPNTDYWIVASAPAGEFLWAFADLATGVGSGYQAVNEMRAASAAGPWSTFAARQQMQLTASVPEPSTLLTIGAVTGVLLTRRKRASA